MTAAFARSGGPFYPKNDDTVYALMPLRSLSHAHRLTRVRERLDVSVAD
jgi:hypothetical protein